MLEKLHTTAVNECESVKLNRLVPVRGMSDIDPFIRVDHFHLREGGFPKQIHDGFEGIFYLFSGSIHHEDSIGNYFDIHAGGAELFTAGAGLVHSEMAEENAHGIRIWLDLPADKKQMPPLYQRQEVDDFPFRENKSVSVRNVIGKGSPLETQTPMELQDVTMCSQSAYKYCIPEGFQGFVYVVVGSIKIGGKQVEASEQVVFTKNHKDLAILTYEGARILICFGQPHGEPIAAQNDHVE